MMEKDKEKLENWKRAREEEEKRKVEEEKRRKLARDQRQSDLCSGHEDCWDPPTHQQEPGEQCQEGEDGRGYCQRGQKT